MLASNSCDWRGQGNRQNETSFSELNISSNIFPPVFLHTQELLRTDSFESILMTFVKPLNEGTKKSPTGKVGKCKNSRGPEKFHPVETFLYKAAELFQTVICCFETEEHTTTARARDAAAGAGALSQSEDFSIRMNLPFGASTPEKMSSHALLEPVHMWRLLSGTMSTSYALQSNADGLNEQRCFRWQQVPPRISHKLEQPYGCGKLRLMDSCRCGRNCVLSISIFPLAMFVATTGKKQPKWAVFFWGVFHQGRLSRALRKGQHRKERRKSSSMRQFEPAENITSPTVLHPLLLTATNGNFFFWGCIALFQ